MITTDLNSKKEILIKYMTKVMLEKMESYQTDFTAYDIPHIINTDEDILFWLVRDTGTHIITRKLICNLAVDNDVQKIIDCFIGTNKWYYEANLREGKLTELSLEEIEDRISRLVEEEKSKQKEV